MLHKEIKQSTLLEVNNAYEGRSIEQKMRAILTSGEPIEETAPQIFTEKKDGILPQYDIRTDRFDIALEAMDKVNRSNAAKSAPAPANPEPTNQEPKTE